MYGKILETWKKELLTSSGVDVWVKRTRHLVVNDMYRTMDLFDIHGPAQDDYKVGKTRGCGGLGICKDGRLYVSKNWRTYRMIATGPIRSEFKLTYHVWNADGRMFSETKHISIDVGSNLSRFQSTFSNNNKSPLTIGVGLAERPGDKVIVPEDSQAIDSWVNTTAKGLVVQNQHEGWMTYWQPQDFVKGTIGVAIVLPKGSVRCLPTTTRISRQGPSEPQRTRLGKASRQFAIYWPSRRPRLANRLFIALAPVGARAAIFQTRNHGRTMSGVLPNAATSRCK